MFWMLAVVGILTHPSGTLLGERRDVSPPVGCEEPADSRRAVRPEEGGQGFFIDTPTPPKPLPPVAAKAVTLTKGGTLAAATAEMTKQTDIRFDFRPALGETKVRGGLTDVPFWDAVEALAADTKCFVGVQGSKLAFTPRPDGVPAPPSSISGPFRVVLKRVTAERDLEAAGTTCRVVLEVQWEPRFPVLLIDAEKVKAVAGQGTFADATAFEMKRPTHPHAHEVTIRLKDIPRDAKTLDELTGSFRLIAADKTLAVEFKDLTADTPTTMTTDGVGVTLLPAKGLAKRVEFGVKLVYPEGHPKMDSYQGGWSLANGFRLFAPGDPDGRPFDSQQNVLDDGRNQELAYSYPNPAGVKFAAATDLKGWRAVYHTPGPMREQVVPFKLKGIPLP